MTETSAPPDILPGTVLQTDALRIIFEPGEGRHAVVSFTGLAAGMGGLASMEPTEFRRSLDQGNADGGYSMIFVSDLRRRWYNDGIADTIVAKVNELLATTPATRVICLGNSMGGFAAVALAARIRRCKRVLAFAPQSSVHPDIAGFDPRWTEHTDAITQWDLPDSLSALSPAIDYHIFMGSDRDDIGHTKRFTDAGHPSLHLHHLPAAGHQVAGYLKREGVLPTLLQEFIRRGRENLPSLNGGDLSELRRRAARQARRAAPQ